MVGGSVFLFALVASCVFIGCSQRGVSATSVRPVDTGGDQVAAPSSLSEVELETGDEDEDALEDPEEDTKTDAQHLFPSFSSLFPPLGHSRPSFFPESRGPSFQLEAFRYSPRSNPGVGGGTQQQLLGEAHHPTDPATADLLGSGNLGVIRGGTYYGGGGAGGGGAGGGEGDSPRGQNSHSRPYRRPNPPPLYRSGGDFFQGFRDFADITVPAKGAYSQYVVVYANRKGAHPGASHPGPRNIMEQLEMIDAEEKKSKNKKKLQAYKEKEKSIDYKKKTKKFPKQDLHEPLLALS